MIPIAESDPASMTSAETGSTKTVSAATRFATYQLSMGETAAAYVKMHLSDPAFLEWRATGLASDTELSQYDMGLPHAPWPGSAAG